MRTTGCGYRVKLFAGDTAAQMVAWQRIDYAQVCARLTGDGLHPLHLMRILVQHEFDTVEVH
jgi:hypothetical protein